MLDSLSVSNFRLFKELKIERLGRVNLFSGRNSTGKSCLLEAVNVYSRNANPNVLFDLITSRNEEITSEIFGDEKPEDPLSDNPLRHLFRGHIFPSTPDDGICIGNLAEPGKLKIYISPSILSGLSDNNVLPMEIFAEINGDIYKIAPINIISKRSLRYIHDVFKIKHQLQIVPSRGLSDREVALLWDKINLTPLEEEVVRALNIIQPAITGIALIGSAEDSKGRLPVVRIKGMNERVPLKSLGDGAVRLLHVILALVNAENGVLLLDEAENGLHWSAQDKLWQIVFQLSARLHVQVFATTHSRDCIQGFHGAWQDDVDGGAFFRLDADAEMGARCTPYPLRSLGSALKTGVEMR